MSNKNNLPKIIVIVGPTTSGKTDLGIFLARKFNGEVISADSRQIYREFNIGTAKPKGGWMRKNGKSNYVVEGVIHYLIDVIDPKEDFTLSDYKKMSLAAIAEVLKKGKVPLLVGGTALYIYTIVENFHVPSVKSSPALRSRLEKKRTVELFRQLKRLDPQAAEITGQNKRRLIRALEVIENTGKKFSELRKKGPLLFKTLKIAPALKQEEILKRIETRTKRMLEAGLLVEVKDLAKRYSWALPPMQTIDYQEFKEYLQGKESLAKAVEKANKAHKEFARRQMTWFKRDKQIHWIKDFAEAEKLVEQFL